MYSGRIYKLDEHTKRLFHSAEILGIKIPYTEEEISRACYEAAEAQSIVDGYVRPVAFRAAQTMPTVSAQKAGVRVAISIQPRNSKASGSTSRIGSGPPRTPRRPRPRPRAST
jgi:branched-chain amino acid aminotransferase